MPCLLPRLILKASLPFLIRKKEDEVVSGGAELNSVHELHLVRDRTCCYAERQCTQWKGVYIIAVILEFY
jgi:hypothetical protein